MHETPQSERSPEDQSRLLERLEALGTSLSKTRDEAINGRASSGIEKIWTEDEEHFEGIDDENRDASQTNWNSKPPGRGSPRSDDNRSTEFLNITKPYVEAATAKVSDILLPTDERAWGLTETPIPELEQKAEGELPQEAIEGMQQAGLEQQTVDQVAQSEAAVAAKILAEAKAKAEKAQKRIEDWHVEGNFHAEVRKVLEDATKIGTGVLKGPVPVNKRATMFKDGALVVQDEIKPISKRINPWNFYPDPACGESIHNGNYVWERDFITKKQLQAMKLDPDYIASQIDRCLEEGPRKSSSSNRKTAEGKELDDKSLFEIWYFTGQAEKEDLEAAGCACENETESVPALFTLVNDRVVKGALNPLDSGEFPYDAFPWSRRANSPWGNGVGRQIRTPQRMLVAANRAMLTNGGRAAGPIIVRKNGVITPADGEEGITPWKVYNASESETDDVRKAFTIFEIPDRQQSLMNIIQFALKMAEDVTGLPLLLQGQSGNAPDTLGGQQLVNQNANGVLKRIARTFDDCITEPHVRRYYAWLLQYGEDDEKGDFVIDARGSTALVERDIYKQELAVLGQMSLNPAFELDPAKIAAEQLRVSRRAPDKFQLSEEQKQARAKAQAEQGANDPRTKAALEVAKTRSDGDLKKAEMVNQADMAEIQAKAAEAKLQREHEMALARMQHDAEIVKLSAASGLGIDKIKADLARDVIKIRAQKDMQRAGHRAKQMLTPPTEPAGRAPPGQAFER